MVGTRRRLLAVSLLCLWRNRWVELHFCRHQSFFEGLFTTAWSSSESLHKTYLFEIVRNHPYSKIASGLSLPIVHHFEKCFAFSGFTYGDKNVLREKMWFAQETLLQGGWRLAESPLPSPAGQKTVSWWKSPRKKQVRREARCTIFKRVYKERRGTDFSLFAGNNSALVVTSG